MDIGLLGYLITFINVQNTIKDSSINIAPISALITEINKHPEFPIERFRDNGFQRVNDMSIYLSNNTRDYIFHNKGKDSDEGVMIKLFHEPVPNREENGILAYFFNKEHIDDQFQRKVDEYINSLGKNRRRPVK